MAELGQPNDANSKQPSPGTTTICIPRAVPLALLCAVALVAILHQTTEEASAITAAATPDDLQLSAARGDFPDSFRVVSQMSWNEMRQKR